MYHSFLACRRRVRTASKGENDSPLLFRSAFRHKNTVFGRVFLTTGPQQVVDHAHRLQS